MPFLAALGAIGGKLLGSAAVKTAVGAGLSNLAAKKIRELRSPTFGGTPIALPGGAPVPMIGGGRTFQVAGLGSALPQAIQRALPVAKRVGGAVVAGGRAAIGATRRFLNTPGGKWTKKAIRDFGLIVVGGLVYDAAGNLMGSVQRRRMNPMNARALRRSIRRVKSARKICADIERMLPKKRAAAGGFKRRKC